MAQRTRSHIRTLSASPRERRRRDGSSTGVHDHDVLQTRTTLACIKKRITRAIRSEFPPEAPEFQWMHSNKRHYLAGLRRLHSRNNEASRLATAFTEHYEAYSTRTILALCAFKQKDPNDVAGWNDPAIRARRVREIESAAQQIDTTSRAVPAFTSVSDSGSKARTVHSFGIVDYARQLGLSDYIACVGPSSYNDYSAPGAGGIGAHIRRIRQLVANGYNYFLSADVRQAFPSVRPHDVANLVSIPEWAMQNVMFCTDATRTWTTTTTNNHSPNASCGLPQGSVCSGSAWSMVAGSILRPLAGERRDISQYVDDILASARSLSELEHLYREMEEGFHRASGGRLRLGKVRVTNIECEPLDFLSHRMTLLPDRQLLVRPSPAAWIKAAQRCEDKLQAVVDNSLVPDPVALLDEAETYYRRWVASFPEWKTADPSVKHRLRDLHISETWHRFCYDRNIPLPDIA